MGLSPLLVLFGLVGLLHAANLKNRHSPGGSIREMKQEKGEIVSVTINDTHLCVKYFNFIQCVELIDFISSVEVNETDVCAKIFGFEVCAKLSDIITINATHVCAELFDYKECIAISDIITINSTHVCAELLDIKKCAPISDIITDIGVNNTHVCADVMGHEVCANLGDIIKINDTHICVEIMGFERCFDIKEDVCGIKVPGFSLGCASDEENYLGLCYQKCSILAGKDYPLRIGTNTCDAKDGCGHDEENDAGLCYPNCEAHYNGVGPVCWGSCKHFCGEDFEDMGLYCYDWWPPKSCDKPSYGRGVGTFPKKPWTKGIGCDGFGVDNRGECAKIDISDRIPGLEC